MKQLTYFLFTAALFCSCKKDSVRVFDETPEERMGARINELNSKLTEAEHGWKVALTTSAKGGYGFYMDFDAAQKVAMVADLNASTATELKESTFRIKWVMNATLVFDTYNYISMLHDPSPSVYGGTGGSGLQSDVEFEYQRSTADSVFLKGFKYRNDMILVKATAEEKSRYMGASFRSNIDAINDFFTVKQNNYVTIPGITNKVELVLDKANKTALFQYINNDGAVVQVKAKYNFEDVGVNFPLGLSINGVVYTKGKLENDEFVLYTKDGTKNVIKQNDSPILPMKELFAYNGTYKELFIGNALPTGITSGFNAVYQACVSKFAAMNPSRTLVDVRFILANSTTATVTTRNNNGTTTFIAVASYKYTYENGVLTLTSPTYDGNWTARVGQLIDIQNYFASGPFRVDYATSSNPNVTNIGGLYRVADNSSFFYGSLRK